MILKKDQKEDIMRRIDFIKIQLADLEQFKNINWDIYRTDRNIQRNIERLAENVANAAIDISKVLLVSETVELPNSYRDIILKLGEAGILTPEQSEKLARYAGLRNVLAHQYLDLKWEGIKNFIQNAAKDFGEFIPTILKRIGNS